MVYIFILYLYSCFLTQMSSRYCSMIKLIRWTDLLLCNWWTLLIVPLYDYSVGFLKCSDNVVIFRFSFHYRKFVTLIIPWWLIHCLLSGGDFVPTLWYFLFSYLIIGNSWHWLFRGDIHCLLSGVDFIILVWYYLFSYLIIGNSWHWLFCGDWYIVCWVEGILSSSFGTILQDLCWNSSRNMWCRWG